MGLFAKFMLLISLLSVAVFLDIAVVAWAMHTFQTEISQPLSSVRETIQELHRMRIGLREQASIIEAHGVPDARETERFGRLSSVIEEHFKAMSTSYLTSGWSGLSTHENLRTRVQALPAQGQRWADAQPGAREAVAASVAALSLLVDQVEGKVIQDTTVAVDFGDRLKGRIVGVMMLSVLFTLASLGFAGVCVRRWVIRPINDLRDGARRFASGDLQHRVPASRPDELGVLAHEFNEMASTIGTLQQQRVEQERLAAFGEMARRIVHNLRSPLAGIRGLAETTREELPPTSDLREVQHRIISSVDRFERWLRDLLHTTSPLTIQPRPVALRAWLAERVDDQRGAAEAREVTLELTIDEALPQQVAIDDRQLEQALVAVLANAVEASPPGGSVWVRAYAAADGGFWVVEIVDSGPGVPADLRARVFEPYFSTKPRGNGIGLAVAKSVIQAHRGRIEIADAAQTAPCEPKTAFRITLPLEPPSPAAPQRVEKER